jgi:hypothetical protein
MPNRGSKIKIKIKSKLKSGEKVKGTTVSYSGYTLFS